MWIARWQGEWVLEFRVYTAALQVRLPLMVLVMGECEYCGGKHLDAKCQERCKDEIWEGTAMIELIGRQILQANSHLLDTRTRLNECRRKVKQHRKHLGTKGQSRLDRFLLEVNDLKMEREQTLASIKDKEKKSGITSAASRKLGSA